MTTLLATTGLAGVLPFLLILACPLMMIFMMRGMHGGHGRRASRSRERMSTAELEHARDELNDEIGQRARR